MHSDALYAYLHTYIQVHMNVYPDLIFIYFRIENKIIRLKQIKKKNTKKNNIKGTKNITTLWRHPRY